MFRDDCRCSLVLFGFVSCVEGAVFVFVCLCFFIYWNALFLLRSIQLISKCFAPRYWWVGCLLTW